MMKLSEQITRLQVHLDKQLPRAWLWIAGDLQELGVQATQLEAENAKLLQAVNDKDQELFESQELVVELLEALNGYFNAHNQDRFNLMEDAGMKYSPCDCALCLEATEAIRKAVLANTGD